jgi:hypothetical protein
MSGQPFTGCIEDLGMWFAADYQYELDGLDTDNQLKSGENGQKKKILRWTVWPLAARKVRDVFFLQNRARKYGQVPGRDPTTSPT